MVIYNIITTVLKNIKKYPIIERVVIFLDIRNIFIFVYILVIEEIVLLNKLNYKYILRGEKNE